MDVFSLKKSVEAVEMPDDMHKRILNRSKKILEQNMEEYPMKNANIWLKRPVAVVAVLVLCLCLPVAGAAMSNAGFFKDITRWNGAVTGVVYEQAANEIDLAVASTEDTLAVTAVLLTPDSTPYRECEELAIGNYQIVDSSGNVVTETNGTDFTAIEDGRAVWTIPLDRIADGAYTLQIQSFVSSKKADQPLQIKGFWECDFSK